MSVPSQVTNVQTINQFDGKHVLVTWDVATSNPPAIGYDVYRANVDDFAQAAKLNPLPVTILQYMADQNQGLREEWYYFVTCVNVEGSGPPSSSVSAGWSEYQNVVTGNMKFLIPEVIRRRRLILELDGEDGYILVKKVSGERCSCYDVRRSAGQPDCPECYGTNYKGGYVSLLSRFRILSQAELVSRQELGLQVDHKPRGWLVTYPVVKTADVIVRKDNKRMRILDVYDGRVNGVLTRISFDLQEIEPTDPIYSFPVA